MQIKQNAPHLRTTAVAYRGGGLGGSTPPQKKFRRPSKIVPNSTRLWKLLNIAEFRTPTHQDVQKKGSKILKLPSVRICFTLAMTNKLVVIINSLKVPKIKNILLYEMKFLVPNYSCLQNPLTRGLPPPDPPFSLPSVLNWICWTPPPNKIPGHATGRQHSVVQNSISYVSQGTSLSNNYMLQQPNYCMARCLLYHVTTREVRIN